MIGPEATGRVQFGRIDAPALQCVLHEWLEELGTQALVECVLSWESERFIQPHLPLS